MRIILFFLLPVLLFSCKEKDRVLRSSSKDNRCHVRISGKTDFSFYGWHAELMGSMDDPAEVGFKTDLYCKDFDSSCIHLQWPDKRHCRIQVNEKDGTIRNFNADFDESSQIHIYEAR